MTDAFIGQIQVFPYSFAPINWVICDGRTLPINQNAALYSLLGNFYGGDGRTTFGIPNLLGRASYGAGGGGPTIGASTGASTVTLDTTQLAAHTHNLAGATPPGTVQSAANDAFATTAVGSKGMPPTTGFNRYSTSTANTAMASGSLSSTGNGLPHNNMQPYLGMNYYICLLGNYPSRP